MYVTMLEQPARYRASYRQVVELKKIVGMLNRTLFGDKKEKLRIYTREGEGRGGCTHYHAWP